MTNQPVSWRNVLLKALVLFLVANLLFAATDPRPALGRLSLYNRLFPGRLRLPYGERPDLAYNLSLNNLEAMFASHEIAQPRPAETRRVVLIGDSATWGYLLRPEQTLAARLKQRGFQVYNLGYPTLSATKDLLLLQYALRCQPDLIIWLVTLESLPLDKQLTSPIVQKNAAEARRLIADFNLRQLNPPAEDRMAALWSRTLWGARRDLADLFWLQMYGILWAGTGIDQYYPAAYDPPQSDLEADQTFHGLQPPTLRADDLALDVLAAGVQMAGDTPVLLVNEPIYLSQGKNSDLRYNFFYPRWAYDQYRQLLAERCQQAGWRCLDAWDWTPAAEFTNSAIHRSPAGEQQLAEALAPVIQEILGGR